MNIRRLIVRLRITLVVLIAVFGLSAVGGILYLNNQGLNKDIRAKISSLLAENGMYVEFDSLSYHLTKGLVVKNVIVYADETRTSQIAHLPSLIVNMDKTKLLRGIKKINNISLLDGHLEVPLDPKQPNGTRITIDKINGKIEFPDNQSITTKDLKAIYQGIEIDLTINLWKKKVLTRKEDPDAGMKRALAYEKFLRKLALYQWDESTPPKVRINAEGDINDPKKIKVDLVASALSLKRRGFSMNDVTLVGEFSHNLLIIDKLTFNDGENEAEFSGDFDLANRDGTFKIKSYIHIKRFVHALFDKQILKGTRFGSSYVLAEGEFKLQTTINDIPFTSSLPSFMNPFKGHHFSVMGEAKLSDFSHLGSQFDTLASDFSFSEGNLYLDKLVARNKDGFLKLRLLIKNRLVRYKAESTLPLISYKPFFKDNEKIERTLKQIRFQEDSSLYFSSEGQINADDLTDWAAKGSISLTCIHIGDSINATSLVSSFDSADGRVSADIELTGAQICGFELARFKTDLLWQGGVFNLSNTEISDNDIDIGKLNTDIKVVDGCLKGNITLIDAKIKNFKFKQLNAALQGTKDSGLHGRIHIQKPTFKDQELDSIKADFNSHKNLTVKNIEIDHSSGHVKGSIMQHDDGYVYFDFNTTANPHIFLPLIKYQSTKNYILLHQFNKKSKVTVSSKGRVNLKNPKDWQATGEAELNDFTMNGVPLHKLVSSYDINNSRIIINKSDIVFDYSNYSLCHNSSKSARQGRLNIEQVQVDFIGKTATIINAAGTAYPAPVTRMFHKETADHLEQYKFFSPPKLRAAGVIDIVSRPVGECKMNFQCNLACPNNTIMYSFLDGNLLLKNFKANVHIYRNIVEVNKISCSTFRGPVKGDIHFTLGKNKKPSYVGNFNLLGVSFRDIGVTYNFDEIPQGNLTGNINFKGAGDDVRNFNATGNISLSGGNIFSAPVLGPISLILNPLLPGKGNLNERLKNLSANFTVKNGVLHTDNIQSLTPSMTFVGLGWVDLKTEKMDITIQVNYRGIIGLTMRLGAEVAKLPFQMLRAMFLNRKPEVAGLLQLRGTGKYKDPRWVPVQFDVKRGFKGKLFNPPKAVIVP